MSFCEHALTAHKIAEGLAKQASRNFPGIKISVRVQCANECNIFLHATARNGEIIYGGIEKDLSVCRIKRRRPNPIE